MHFLLQRRTFSPSHSSLSLLPQLLWLLFAIAAAFLRPVQSQTDEEVADRHSNTRHNLNAGKQLALDFPELFTVSKGSTESLELVYREKLSSDLELIFDFDPTILKVDPVRVLLRAANNDSSARLAVTGLSLSSRTFIDLKNCSLLGPGGRRGPCPFSQDQVFIRVEVAKSRLITLLVTISGWVYFLAWSISFYPQILLNWQRKSVIGLNFDFLLLNLIGFTCYTIYNVLMYFDANVQDIYVARHGHRSLIPVLLNDVVFAAHALLACIITGIQCFIYEKGNQRISYTCRGWAALLLCFAAGSLLMALLRVFNWLDYINCLAYVKMSVTLSKYFPQAILNFRRKSTIGWSIGNVLLDFVGGSMDIIQMVLQASNTNDWSAFLGNPVKFGLGLVSIIFDVLFMVQHYLLYPLKALNTYDPVSDDSASPTPPQAQTLSVLVDEQQRTMADGNEPVVFPRL